MRTEAKNKIKNIVSKYTHSGASPWNSHFDAVKRIVETGPKLSDVCQAIGAPKFKQAELECLEEYITVMQPVAVTLDKLQQQNDTFFGHVLPTLYMVQMKLQVMLHKPLKYSEPLVMALLLGTQNRFGKELSFIVLYQTRLSLQFLIRTSSCAGYLKIGRSSVVTCLLMQRKD